jgi:hypothetical protein
MIDQIFDQTFNFNCFKFDRSFDPITIDQTNALGSIRCLNQPLISIVSVISCTFYRFKIEL